jgi:hypothetical protein
MKTLKRNIPLVGIALVLVAATSVAAVADSNGGSIPPGEGVAQVTEVERSAAEALAVFGKSRTAADVLSREVARSVDKRPIFGVSPDLSRLSIGNTSNSVYVLPARDHVCAMLTVGEGANMTCPPTEQVATGRAGAATVLLQTGDIAVYGIVPDGVGSVSVQTGASSSVATEVRDNAYYAVVQSGTALRTISYSGPSGPVEFPIYDPSLGDREG